MAKRSVRKKKPIKKARATDKEIELRKWCYELAVRWPANEWSVNEGYVSTSDRATQIYASVTHK